MPNAKVLSEKQAIVAELTEKLIASNARRVIWILDESKLLNHLSEVPLPIEVVPFGFSYVMKEVAALGFRPRLRLNDGMPFLTDNGNYILDLAGDSSMDYREKSALLKSLTGVVETGLFPDFCEKLIIGGADGVRVLENR